MLGRITWTTIKIEAGTAYLVHPRAVVDLIDLPDAFVGRAEDSHRALGHVPRNPRGALAYFLEILVRALVLAFAAGARLVDDRPEVVHQRGFEFGACPREALRRAGEERRGDV